MRIRVPPGDITITHRPGTRSYDRGCPCWLPLCATRARSVSGDMRPPNTLSAMDPKLLELLVCPVTKGPLTYDREAQELVSRSARLAYPVRDGIPVLLENEARPLSDEELER